MESMFDVERVSVGVLLAKPERSVALEAVLPERLFQVIALQSAEELHQAFQNRCFDVLVIENRLPGSLCGLEVLERVLCELQHPETLLLIEPTNEHKRIARELGIRRLLSPLTAADTVAEAIRELARNRQKIWVKIRPEARSLVEKAKEIVPLPPLVVNLTPFLTMADSALSPPELAASIAVDPRVSAHLLSCVNGAGLGGTQLVGSVRDAVALLGVRRSISVVLASQTVFAQKQLTRSALGGNAVWYQKRTILIASASFAFAKHLSQVSEETAYVLGLLQNVGISGFARALGTRYERLLGRFRQTGPLRLEVLETAEYRANHAELSAAIFERWGLPQALIAPVCDHHTYPIDPEKPRTEQWYLQVMQAAEAFANLMDGHLPHRFPLFLQLLKQLGPVNLATMRRALCETVQKTAESGAIFHVPVDGQYEMNQLVKTVLNHILERS